MEPTKWLTCQKRIPGDPKKQSRFLKGKKCTIEPFRQILGKASHHSIFVLFCTLVWQVMTKNSQSVIRVINMILGRSKLDNYQYYFLIATI